MTILLRNNNNNNNNEAMMMIHFRRHAISLFMIFGMSIGIFGTCLYLDLGGYLISTTTSTPRGGRVVATTTQQQDELEFSRRHSAGGRSHLVKTRTRIEDADDDDDSSAVTSATTALEMDEWKPMEQQEEHDKIFGKESDDPLNLVICTRVR